MTFKSGARGRCGKYAIQVQVGLGARVAKYKTSMQDKSLRHKSSKHVTNMQASSKGYCKKWTCRQLQDATQACKTKA